MGNKNDRWSALSMSDRADLIKLYVNNGITSLDIIKKDYNSFGDGGDTEGDDNNDSTTPERKLTLEEFLQAKADSTRLAAHAKSLSRDEGVEIIYPLSESRKEANQQLVDQYYDLNPEFVGPILLRRLSIKPAYNQAMKELNNNCEYGLNCIGTATDNYPEDSREVSNESFRGNYEEKGFYIVPFEEKLPGDIVQQGGHSVIFDSYKRDPHPTLPQAFGDAYPVYNYSNGGIGTEVYRKQKRYPFTEPVVYRYKGTPSLIQQWTEEYNEQNKKFGGKLNLFAPGGPKDTKQVEDVVRTTRGSTGKIFTKDFPFVDFLGAKHLWDSWRVMRGNDGKVATSDDNYTGTAMVGVGVQTDDGLGFASQQDLANTLGYTPKDFVDTYVYGVTPFEELGVFKKETSPERHVVRSKVKKVEDSGKQVNTYQTQRDTLDANTVAALDSLLNAGLVDLHSENTTYQESPFNIGDSGIIYDGNNSTIATAYLPNGMPVSKAIDVFDTEPKEWNYKIGPLAKTGLSFIHDNTNPFLMTTPWYYPIKSTDFLSRLYYLFGIEADPEYNVISNKGDKNGVIWDLHEALEWLDSHPDLAEMPVKTKKD